MMKKFLFTLLLCVSIQGLTKGELPEGCHSVFIKSDKSILQTEKPTLIMLHNLSDNDVWITHPVDDPGASAGWNTCITKDKWSALFIANPFEISCIEAKPGHEQSISCKDVLAVCKWKHINFHLETGMSAFWAGEDMSLAELKAYLGREGFELNAIE